MKKDSNYYVYGYIRLDNNTYFYIGKGRDRRCERLDNRKTHFKNIINKNNKPYKNITIIREYINLPATTEYENTNQFSEATV